MTGVEFEKYWKNHYGDFVPLGYLLRCDCYDEWFRIHSLPQSKRYAATKEEEKILLDRQNQLLEELIGENNEYITLYTDIRSKGEERSSTGTVLPTIRLDTHPYFDDDYEIYLHSFFENKKWKKNSIDTLLMKMANDQSPIPNVASEAIFVNTNKNRIIAPYDGGVDIICSTKKERDFYKSKFSSWLSLLPSGM